MLIDFCFHQITYVIPCLVFFSQSKRIKYLSSALFFTTRNTSELFFWMSLRKMIRLFCVNQHYLRQFDHGPLLSEIPIYSESPPPYIPCKQYKTVNKGPRIVSSRNLYRLRYDRIALPLFVLRAVM